MKPFKVIWEIEVDGENDVDAALTALKIQRDLKSMAKVFRVEQISTGEETHVDLDSING